MKWIVQFDSNPRRMPVQWIDDAACPWRPSFRQARFGRRPARLPLGRVIRPRGHYGRTHGFTILELMVVLAIIGFIAALALPHVAGFNRANAVNAATRQLMDDIALARQKAMASRSTVYMVFVPPAFYTQNPQFISHQGMGNETLQFAQQTNGMLNRQYTSYALLALRSIGDQPGRHYPHYLTDWRTLPEGIYISPFMFASNLPPNNYTWVYTTNTLLGTYTTNVVYDFSWASVPFPSVEYGTNYWLPYIGFTPEGTLTSTYTNQYIMLTRGSVFYPETSNGVYLAQAPLLSETPPGNSTNNPCLLQIDWLTSRGNIVMNQFK